MGSTTAASTTAAITTEGLTKEFGALRALDGLDLHVPAGIVFGFLGTNGAGKSTTIRLLLGLLEPTSGRAVVAGYDCAREGDQVRGSCGVLLDTPGLYDRMTAEENLDFAGRVWRMPAADRAARSRELFEHIGLYDRRTETPEGWSLGMRKKLAVARAVYHRPPVAFLDEPTAGLDPIARAALRDDIVGLAREEGTTVFLTTHDLDDAQRMCTRVAILRQGKLLAEGRPDEVGVTGGPTAVALRTTTIDDAGAATLRALDGVRSVTVDDDHFSVVLEAGTTVPALVQRAVGAGLALEEVRPERSLEDAFLSLVEESAGTDAP
jgi:ABC-2 type transport system ATP-binding protein